MKTLNLLFIIAGLLSSSSAFAFGPSSERGSEGDQSEAEPRQLRRVQVVQVVSDETEARDKLVGPQGKVVFLGEDGTVESSLFSLGRGYLGIQLLELTAELRTHFGVPSDAGVMVSKVVADSPAQRAGLEPGDIITALDGAVVSSARQISKAVAEADDQTQIEIEVWRDDARITLPATIEAHGGMGLDLVVDKIFGHGSGHSGAWLDPDEIQKHVIKVDPKGMENFLQQLEVRLESPDFVDRLQVLGQSRLELQQRIVELEQRLDELERQLDRLPRD